MDRRLELQAILEALLGSKNVYFQPPNNLIMKFPCIIYNRDDVAQIHANNLQYRATTRYQLTIVDHDPDSPIPGKVARLPMCAFDRFFAADNLNHDVYNIYF